MDLLLINPGNRVQAYQSLASSLSAVEPPIWAGLVATFIRRHGFSVAILDANAENLGPEETAKEVARRSPLLTAVVVYGHNPSASTQVMPAAGAICRAIRRMAPGGKTILFGGHVAALPEQTLREESADFTCDGEGPYTLLELLRALAADKQPDYSKVRGLRYRDGETLRSTPPAPLVANLDLEMPGVAWDLLPMDRYRAHNWHCFGEASRTPYAAIYTTLGCPFHCSFCCIQAPFKSGEKVTGIKDSVNTYRLWSPHTVIDQIDYLVRNYGVRHIKLADELFVLNPKHVHTLCDLIIERGYDLNFWAYARIDTLKDDMLGKLKRAGFNWLALGIEAANDRVRKDVNKGYDRERLRHVIDGIRKAGIHIIGNFIFGLPEDDLATMQETLDLAIELHCEFINFTCAMAYPGSKLYDIAMKEGWPLPKEWSGYSQYAEDALPLPTRHVPGAEVLRFRDQAFRTYFRNPSYLEMIRQKFGEEALRQIEEINSHTLRRNALNSK